MPARQIQRGPMLSDGKSAKFTSHAVHSAAAAFVGRRLRPWGFPQRIAAESEPVAVCSRGAILVVRSGEPGCGALMSALGSRSGQGARMHALASATPLTELSGFHWRTRQFHGVKHCASWSVECGVVP